VISPGSVSATITAYPKIQCMAAVDSPNLSQLSHRLGGQHQTQAHSLDIRRDDDLQIRTLAHWPDTSYRSTDLMVSSPLSLPDRAAHQAVSASTRSSEPQHRQRELRLPHEYITAVTAGNSRRG
jgi:hypothetical protein